MIIIPILWLIVALIALLPMYIFWIGYRKTQTKDLYVTAAAFTLFFIKALMISIVFFMEVLNEQETWYYDDEFWVGVAAILDMIIIGLIASALTGRFTPTNGLEPSIPTENGENDEGKAESGESVERSEAVVTGKESESTTKDASS